MVLAKGDPDFLLIAASLNTFKDHIYLAKLPRSGKLLFALLAPFARMAGYKTEVKPVHTQSITCR